MPPLINPVATPAQWEAALDLALQLLVVLGEPKEHAHFERDRVEVSVYYCESEPVGWQATPSAWTPAHCCTWNAHCCGNGDTAKTALSALRDELAEHIESQRSAA